jgi:hypothetical protein
MSTIDTLPYKTYNKLKSKYVVKTVLIRDDDIGAKSLMLLFKDHREYVAHLFKNLGVEVYRWSHNYTSLDTSSPELGLVYLANDSVVVPGIEVHALIGHNARYING